MCLSCVKPAQEAGFLFLSRGHLLLTGVSMKKIAVFGKPGSGKSTLSKALSSVTGIPLYPLDTILYEANGDTVDFNTYDRRHEDILASERWIIDGFDRMTPFKKRLDAADTLIYIDLAYSVSYYFVTKRLLKGLLIKPEGWPDGSSILKGSLQSYKMLKLCPHFWNADFSQKLQERSSEQTVHIIRSTSELNQFVEKICEI